jgi:acyl carrier protein
MTQKASQIIHDAIAGLRASGVLETDVEVRPDTVLLGNRSPLDSFSFVSLMSDLEERLSEQTGHEVFLLFDEIHEFNRDKSSLTVGTLAAFIERLLDRS